MINELLALIELVLLIYCIRRQNKFPKGMPILYILKRWEYKVMRILPYLIAFHILISMIFK